MSIIVIRLQNGQTHTVFKLKDIEELVDHEIYKAITYFVENGEDENIQSKYNELKKECDINGENCISYHACLSDIGWKVDRLIDALEDEDIEIDKDELLERLYSIQNSINNEI